MITVWQGSANTWDCDEMGHMNVRVYVEKALEGLGAMAHAIDMRHAFSPNAPSTLIPADQHIRFLREARPGRPLTMQACVLEIGDHDAVIYQEMRHGDGTPAAAFRTRVLHVESGAATPFPWSSRSRAALERQIGEPPVETAPRSIVWPAACLSDDQATLAEVERVGAPLIGLGCAPAAHMDLHGRMRADWFMGRVSDSVPNLLADWRREVAAAEPESEMGAAVLEYRFVYRKWPRAGDILQIHSALGDAGEKTHSLVHWIMDPASGRAWATAEALAVTFDLNTRKILPTRPEQIEQLAQLAPRGLTV